MSTEASVYMEFSNKGEVPLNAFKLLGASTKREVEGKIGFFGTGLKYSVALMLREGINFKAFIGDKEVKFGIRQSDFGGIKVGVITVNGEKTSMTTDAGIDWQPWFAIREIYSNALDEGGTMELTSDIKPAKGTTKIYVEMSPKLGDVSKNWQSYFAMKREALEEIILSKGTSNERLYRILAKREGQQEFILFRRGIRVAKARNVNSLFDYDVSHIKINESRVVENDWEGRQRAAEALAQSNKVEIVRQFVKAWTQDVLEHEDRFWSYLYDDNWSIARNGRFSQTWLDVLKPYRIVPSNQTGFYGVTAKTIGLPDSLIKKLYEQFGDQLTIEGLSKQHYIVTGDFPVELEKTYQLLSKAGITYPKDSIKLAKFRDYDVRGCYDSKEAIIALYEDCIRLDEYSKAILLLEEMLHAESGYGDNTRQFEGFIMGKLLNRIMEEQNA